MLIPSPVSDLPMLKERGFKSFWVMKVTGLHFRAVRQDPISCSPPRCAFVCEAAWECTGRVLFMSRAFIIRIDYRGNWLERMPGCQCCWGEQADSLRLVRADHYFSRIKELNREVWGILLHF